MFIPLHSKIIIDEPSIKAQLHNFASNTFKHAPIEKQKGSVELKGYMFWQVLS